jgi:hypothetical protein
VKQKWLLMTEICLEEIISALPEKCTRQPVQTVKLRQKCLSNLTQKDRFTAESVFLTTGRPEKTADIKPEFRFGSTRSVSLRSSGLIHYFFKYTLDSEYTFFLNLLQILKEPFAGPFLLAVIFSAGELFSDYSHFVQYAFDIRFCFGDAFFN